MTRTRERLITPAFVLLSAADLGYFTAAGVSIYALPLYVTGPLGGGRAAAGFAVGIFAVSALVLRPFAGRLTDTVGRTPLLVGGALLCAAGFAMTPLATSLLPVIGLRMLLGVAEAAFVVAGFAALIDLAPPTRLGEAISFNSLGLFLGLALGPPLGELLVEQASFTAAWLAAAGLALLAALLVTGIRRTHVPQANPVQLIHRGAIAPGIGLFTSLAAVGGFLAFAALHAQAVGLGNASLPLFVYGLVVVGGRIVFARIPDRMPPLRVAAGALAMITCALVFCAAVPTPAGMIIGTALLALGITFSTPAFFSAIFATARPDQRGAASGTASAFIDLGLGGGPILLGLVAQAAGIPWALATAAAVTLAGSAWMASLAVRA